MLTVRVTYEVEQTERGWIVWRRAQDGQDVAVGPPQRATVYPSRREADEAVESQRRADRAAASRLGITLEGGT